MLHTCWMLPPFSRFLIPLCCSCSSVSLKSQGNAGSHVPIPSIPSEGTDAKAPPCMSKWHTSDSAFLLQENRDSGGVVSCKSSPFCSGGQPGVQAKPTEANLSWGFPRGQVVQQLSWTGRPVTKQRLPGSLVFGGCSPSVLPMPGGAQGSRQQMPPGEGTGPLLLPLCPSGPSQGLPEAPQR